jgi:two-component system, NarL family, nitrate/nitrite response regulator NarL
MRGLPLKNMPLRVAIQGDAQLVQSLSDETDRFILSPVETNLEISARVSQADVILVDANSPGGLEAVKNLQLDRPVLVLANKEQVFKALEAGADSVLSRETPPERIGSALEALSAGLFVIDPAFVSLFREGHPAPAAVSLKPAGDVLTNREHEVLVLLAEGLTISEHTAKFHVNSILQKMNAQKRVEAVVRAAKRGLIQI